MGAALIVSSSFIAGISFLTVLQKRIKALSFMIELLTALKIKISYEFSALPIVLRELQNQNNYQNNEFLRNCVKELDKGLALKKAWGTSLRMFSQQMHLTKSDIAVLTDFSSSLGDTDINGQIENITLYLELLKCNLKEAENALKDKSKIALSCSLFGGLIISILLI